MNTHALALAPAAPLNEDVSRWLNEIDELLNQDQAYRIGTLLDKIALDSGSKNSAPRLQDIAKLAHQYGKIDMAVRLQMEHVKYYPQESSAHNFLGILLVHENWLPEAEKEFVQAITMEPDMVLYWDNLCCVKVLAGQTHLVRGIYGKIAQIKEDCDFSGLNSVKLLLDHTLELQRQGHFQKALDILMAPYEFSQVPSLILRIVEMAIFTKKFDLAKPFGTCSKTVMTISGNLRKA